MAVLSGTAEANSSVSIYDGTKLIGTVTAASDGTWSLQSNISGHGIHSFTETSDLAGDLLSSVGVTLYSPSVHKVLQAGNGSDVLFRAPHDTLIGGGGSDTFVFNPNFGKDKFMNFNVNQDVLALDHTLFTNATGSQVISQTHDSSAGAVIVVDAHDTITLTGVSVAQLQAAHTTNWIHFF
jgi:Ca2+-binding RTX toxin-like protein